MNKFCVTIGSCVVEYRKVVVEADTLNRAQEIAEELDYDDLTDTEPYRVNHEQTDVCDVEPVADDFGEADFEEAGEDD